MVRASDAMPFMVAQDGRVSSRAFRAVYVHVRRKSSPTKGRHAPQRDAFARVATWGKARTYVDPCGDRQRMGVGVTRTGFWGCGVGLLGLKGDSSAIVRFQL